MGSFRWAVSVKSVLDSITYTLTEKPRGLDFSRNLYPYGDASDNVWYERTTKKHIRQIFSYFRNKRMPVLDMGCGKGFLLYQLQKMGFAHTDGVEYSPHIAGIAQENMRRLKLQQKVHIYNADARDFDGYDSYQILYMFHPFRRSVMQHVVHNVESSLQRNPRYMYVVYFYPVEHQLWDDSLFFVRKASMTMEFINTELNVYYYEHNPSVVRHAPPSFRDILGQKLARG